MRKNNYSKPEVAYVEVEADSSILTGSIIGPSTIESVSQNATTTYDFSTGFGAEDEKEFNDNWE